MSEDDATEEQIKEVYARFGLALYLAQVLEHGLVNAMLVIDLVPSQRHLMRTREEWSSAVDNFMSRHFANTMGRMMRELRSLTPVPTDLEDLLNGALAKRNWLAHEYFREGAEHFMTSTGRESMLRELDECHALFEITDDRLESVVRPLRISAGLTDEVIMEAFEKMRAKAETAG